MKERPTGSAKDDDVDTLGLDWDVEANRGGADLDTASVAISAITNPATLLGVDRKAPTNNKKNQTNNTNGTKGGPTGSAKDDDVDTLGLDWDAEANRGGADLDTASVAVSAITTPATLLGVDKKAPINNKKNQTNNTNGTKGGPTGSAKDNDVEAVAEDSPWVVGEDLPGSSSRGEGDHKRAQLAGDETCSTIHNNSNRQNEVSASGAAAHATTRASSDTGGDASNDRGNHLSAPGAYRVYPSDYNIGSDDQNDSLISTTPIIGGGESAIHDDDIVVEGFVPEPTENELREAEDAARAQALLDAAVTLDESAIKIIEQEETESSSALNIAVRDAESSDKTPAPEKSTSPFAFVALTGIILTAIALAVGLSSSSSGTGSSDEDSTLISASRACFESHADRYEYAKQMVSKITSLETLDDESTNQNKALTWLVCNDTISANLIDDRDVDTGELPKQVHGFPYSGDAGETQVLRRYALATFYFSTTTDGPWIDSWNFMNGSRHECYWHKNYTSNGDIDPAGVHCGYGTDLIFAFRIFNNLTGTFPPEWGYISFTFIGIENQGPGLRGSIPDTIGNMKDLISFYIGFGGPDLGGLIPASLFNMPALEWLYIQFNEGIWELPPDVEPALQSKIKGIGLRQSGLTGMLPSFISRITSLEILDFAGNSLTGTIPQSWGDLKNVTFLDLHSNNMTGTLPESLGQLASVKALGLGKNSFEGTIPSTLGDLGKLRLLDLSQNQLEGPLPASFSQLSNLGHISLQHNKHLNGTISAFGSLRQLESLLVYNNSFTGFIPAGLFSNYTHSEYSIFADFGHNKFTGKLPDAFSQYAMNTSYLSLMENSFDLNAVQDVTCEEVPILFADCKSCPCCKTCCSGDSTDFCQFDVDFHEMVGLSCGAWWEGCRDISYDPVRVEAENDSEDSLGWLL